MKAERAERIRQQGMEHYGFGPNAMKKLKVCAECGKPSPSDKYFCTECGHRLPNETLYDTYIGRHKICVGCDTVLTDEMEYCPQCGTLIEKYENVNRENRKDGNQ